MTVLGALMDAVLERREGETAEVWRRRFHEAIEAGLSVADAETFAKGSEDIGLLRRLVADGCPPRHIARIVL